MSSQGIAKNSGTNWWDIVDDIGNFLVRFNHDHFPLILSGARVSYTDSNGDGDAETVQPVPVAGHLTASATALHPSLRLNAEARQGLAGRVERALQRRRASFGAEIEVEGVTRIALTTVSANRGFDAWLNLRLDGMTVGTAVQLLVDSGNSVLILPDWDVIAALPNDGAAYEVLGEGSEPWGCPAKVVRGPIELETSAGGSFRIDDCVFYVCTGDGPDGNRTSNFGAGCLLPWSASGWNTPPGVAVTLAAPLSYAGDYRYAVFDYAPVADVLSADQSVKVVSSSTLFLSKDLPAAFEVFDIRPNLSWMSVQAKSLSIGGVRTQWPGSAAVPLAIIDTGGTCAFLSDPDMLVCGNTWPASVPNPTWAVNSDTCESTSDDIEIEIGDASRSYSYKINTSVMPQSVRGLTLVMCKKNEFMRGEVGMNIGGISALTNLILIDYVEARVGFKAK